MEHTIFEIARDMLGVDEIPEPLRLRISRVIELVENVNGSLGTLRSSQVLANIIMEWETDKCLTTP